MRRVEPDVREVVLGRRSRSDTPASSDLANQLTRDIGGDIVLCSKWRKNNDLVEAGGVELADTSS
jgi:hypothetical protein